MRRPTTMLLFTGIALSPAITAQAQVNPFRSSSGAGMTAEDSRMQNTAARRLVANSNPHDGATEDWKNPRTGASGTITVVNSFQKGDMLCRKVEFASETRNSQNPRKTQLDWCKTPQGWKIVSP